MAGHKTMLFLQKEKMEDAAPEVREVYPDLDSMESKFKAFKDLEQGEQSGWEFVPYLTPVMICSGLIAKIKELPDSEVKRILVGEAKREFLQITADSKEEINQDQEGAPDRKKLKHSKSAKGMKPLYEYFVKGKT